MNFAVGHSTEVSFLGIRGSDFCSQGTFSVIRAPLVLSAVLASVPPRRLLECFAQCQKAPQWFKLEKIITTSFPDTITPGAESLQGPRNVQRDTVLLWLEKDAIC